MRSRRRSARLLPAFLAASMLLVLAAPADASPARVDVIVVLDDAYAPGGHGANQARAERIAREHGVTPTQTYGTALFGFSASVPQDRLNGLENDRRVSHVDRDQTVQAFETEEVPWGVSRVGAPLGGNIGAGIHVYVLDTGIDADHPDLETNLGSGHAIEDCKGGGCRGAWDDDQGHGTHVAGTIGAIDNEIGVVGVAPDATLHAVKVLNHRGSGSWSGVIAGVDWVASETASRGTPSVANMSLGGSGSKSGTCTDSGFTGTGSLHQAICNAKNDGVVFAVSAGNSGEDADGFVPAAYDDAVITVSATTSNDTWPSWSNFGNDAATWTTNDTAPVALAAPGAGVLSTTVGGGTGTKSGTSMASPHVAGGAALQLAASSETANGTAFTNTRAALLTGAEDFANLTPHTEDLLDVGFLGTTGSLDPNSAPTAGFTSSCTDLTCGFTDTSSDTDGTVTSWSWEFGDGATSDVQDPNHTYGADGTYTVNLTVTDDAGATDTSEQNVTVDDGVNDPPMASFAATCSSLDCSFDASGSSDDGTIQSYDWTLGDGSTASGATVSHTYGADGTYTVNLTVTDDGGATDTSEQNVTVSTTEVNDEITVAQFGGKDNLQHADLTVTLTDSDGSPVSGVLVTIAVAKDGGDATTSSATTGSDGTVVFGYRNLPSGNYTATVDHVAHADWDLVGASVTWTR